MSKGLRKDIEKRGFLGTQMRSCNSLDRVTIALLPTNRRLGNKKSVRFPRIFALLPWRDHKIRHRRHASLPFQLYVAIAACQTPGTGHKSALDMKSLSIAAYIQKCKTAGCRQIFFAEYI